MISCGRCANGRLTRMWRAGLVYMPLLTALGGVQHVRSVDCSVQQGEQESQSMVEQREGGCGMRTSESETKNGRQSGD